MKNDDDLHEFLTVCKNSQGYRLVLTSTGNFPINTVLCNSTLLGRSLADSRIKLDDSEAAKKQILSETTELAQSRNETEIKVDDLMPFLNDLFAAPETTTKLMDYLSKNPEIKKCRSSSSLKLNIDKQVFSDYIYDKVTEMVKGALPKSLETSNVLREVRLDNIQKQVSEKKPLAQTMIDFTSSIQLNKEMKLNESLSERLAKSSYGEIKKESRGESLTSSKSLLDSCGFRFVMKFDGGKARFVPVPINSLEPENSQQDLSSLNSIEKVQESMRISNENSRRKLVDKATS